MEERERDQLLAKILLFKQKCKEMQAEESWERHQALWDDLFDREMQINEQIHLLFDSAQLRRHVRAFVQNGFDIAISTVRTDDHKSTSSIIDNLDRLQEIDRLMVAHQLEYLWHIHEEYDEGDNYLVYFGAEEIVSEWWARWDDVTENCETPRYSYIPPQLMFARDFFLKHQDNPDLIQVLGTHF